MPFDPPGNRRDIAALLRIMANLRAPDGGCPWDLEQDHASIAKYAIEEAYETVDAIERGDMRDLRDELGDLLLQVVFHAQMASERGAFDFADVVEGVCDKMVRRHPHVFAQTEVDGAGEVNANWEAIKAAERAEKATGDAGLLDDVPVGLPALTRAVKLQKRAARVGFDWTEVDDVLAKLHEEVGELVEARRTGQADAVEAEFGDVLFTLANVARHLKVDPEQATRRTNQKFVTRFAAMERAARDKGRKLEDYSLEELEALWQAAKG